LASREEATSGYRFRYAPRYRVRRKAVTPLLARPVTAPDESEQRLEPGRPHERRCSFRESGRPDREPLRRSYCLEAAAPVRTVGLLEGLPVIVPMQESGGRRRA
jgi:hypothetical protein